MRITEVRIKLVTGYYDDNPLLAFAKFVFDHAFAVEELRVIQGEKGAFVSMPSRRMTDRCLACGAKNELLALSCTRCRAVLEPDRAPRDERGRPKFYMDIAHPINPHCRQTIEEAVLTAYYFEVWMSELPGYFCNYDDVHSCTDYHRRLLQFALNSINGWWSNGRLIWDRAGVTPHFHRVRRFSSCL